MPLTKEARSGARPGVGLGAGLLAVAAYNAWRWRQDEQLAEALCAEQGQQRPAIDAAPTVSILVAAWNEASFIERHIRSIESLRYPNIEYILCAGGADGTYDIARKSAAPGTQVLRQLPGEGKQAALRRAFEESTGEIVYLTDADGLLDDASFERLVEPLAADAAVTATTGGIRPVAEQARKPFVFHQWSSQAYASAHAPAFVRGLLGMNCAVRRDALVAAGAFGGQVDSGTDDYLAKCIARQGGKIRHVRASLAATAYPEDWHEYSRQQSRWLRNIFLHGARFRAYDEVVAASRTMLAGLGMLTLPFIALRVGRLAWAAWLLTFMHSCLSKRRYYRLTRALAFGAEPPSMPATAIFTLGEFAVWALPLFQLLASPWRRPRW